MITWKSQGSSFGTLREKAAIGVVALVSSGVFVYSFLIRDGLPKTPDSPVFARKGAQPVQGVASASAFSPLPTAPWGSAPRAGTAADVPAPSAEDALASAQAASAADVPTPAPSADPQADPTVAGAGALDGGAMRAASFGAGGAGSSGLVASPLGTTLFAAGHAGTASRAPQAGAAGIRAFASNGSARSGGAAGGGRRSFAAGGMVASRTSGGALGSLGDGAPTAIAAGTTGTTGGNGASGVAPSGTGDNNGYGGGAGNSGGDSGAPQEIVDTPADPNDTADTTDPTTSSGGTTVAAPTKEEIAAHAKTLNSVAANLRAKSGRPGLKWDEAILTARDNEAKQAGAQVSLAKSALGSGGFDSQEQMGLANLAKALAGTNATLAANEQTLGASVAYFKTLSNQTGYPTEPTVADQHYSDAAEALKNVDGMSVQLDKKILPAVDSFFASLLADVQKKYQRQPVMLRMKIAAVNSLHGRVKTYLTNADSLLSRVVSAADQKAAAGARAAAPKLYLAAAADHAEVEATLSWVRGVGLSTSNLDKGAKSLSQAITEWTVIGNAKTPTPAQVTEANRVMVRALGYINAAVANLNTSAK
jgi:hypothetical protein